MSIRLLFDIQRIIFIIILILSGLYLILHLLKEIILLFRKDPKKEQKDVIEITKEQIKYIPKKNKDKSLIEIDSKKRKTPKKKKRKQI